MIEDDNLPELYETFRIELLNVQPAEQYASRARVVADGESTATLPSEQIWITDNEPNEFSVRITDRDGNRVMEIEENGNIIFEVFESDSFRAEALFKGEPRANIGFTFTVRDVPTADNTIEAADFEGGLVVVRDTIGGNFDSIASVTITPQNEDDSDGDKRFEIVVESDSTLASQPPVQAILRDDDIALDAEFTEVGTPDYNEETLAHTAAFKLTDENATTRGLTVTVSFIPIYDSASADDFTISSTVIIPPGAGDRVAVLGIEIFDDLIIEGPEFATIAITRLDLSDGSRRVYAPANRPPLRFEINDDEKSNRFTIEGIPSTVEEGKQYTFTIDHNSISDLTISDQTKVTLTVSDPQRLVILDPSGAPLSNPSILTGTLGNDGNPRTFALKILDNDRVEGPKRRRSELPD